MQPVSVYIHVPFCVHRCGYCDFNTYAGLQSLIPEYTHMVCREIELLSPGIGDRYVVNTVYFGGGTPSLLSIDELGEIIETLRKNFQFIPSPEVSLEANPGTISRDYLYQMHSLGVNRLSIGMQSANPGELKLLGRQHTFTEVINAVEWARAAKIDNLNLDLIFGLPKQGLESWMKNIDAAIALQPEHLSLYALTIEPGTPLHNSIEGKRLPLPDEDLAADMYEAASRRLATAGYQQYEISNWARNGDDFTPYFCRHNLQYWRSLPYLGLGAGAHGYIDHQRTVNVLTPGEYIDRFKNMASSTGNNGKLPRTPATFEVNSLDLETEMGETMMMGLRLVSEGVSNQAFQQRFGIRLQGRYAVHINRLISLGLLEWVNTVEEILRLTQRGRLLGNQVFKEFI